MRRRGFSDPLVQICTVPSFAAFKTTWGSVAACHFATNFRTSLFSNFGMEPCFWLGSEAASKLVFPCCRQLGYRPINIFECSSVTKMWFELSASGNCPRFLRRRCTSDKYLDYSYCERKSLRRSFRSRQEASCLS